MYTILNLFNLDKPAPPCELIDNDLAGNDIEAVLDVPSWEQCSDLCSQKSECTVWTWVDDTYTVNPEIIHKCHLKNGNPGPSSVTGLVSGATGCKPGKTLNDTNIWFLIFYYFLLLVNLTLLNFSAQKRFNCILHFHVQRVNIHERKSWNDLC